MGLPLVRLPASFHTCPGSHGLVPQGRDGGLLLALDPRCWDPACGCFDAPALVLDARSREWSRGRLGAGAHAFEVPADGEAHPLALHELVRACPETLGVEPGTGLLRVTDDEGTTRGFHRLRAVPGNARRTVLEVLRVKRTQDGAFPPVVAGARLAAEWVAVATFAGNERWLHVNVHATAVSFAITGSGRPAWSGS